MRTLTWCAALALLAAGPAMAAGLTAAAKSGVKTKISQHMAFGKSCVSQHVVAKITTPPAHGTVTTAEEILPMPMNPKLGDAGGCGGKSGPNAVIYYESKPGFKGQD